MARKSPRWVLCLAVMTATTGGAAGLAGPASAGQPGGDDFPAFTSSPRSGPPGTAVTASGGGCTGAEGGHVSLTRAGSQTSLATAAIRVRSTGEWASTLPVPSDAPAGEYLIGAICTFERGTPNLYRDNRFTIVAAPPADVRRLTVTPASVVLGGSATVHGRGCTPPGTAIAAVTQHGSELEGAQVGSPNAAGEWSVRFVFKAGYVQPDATIAVTARCFAGDDRVRFAYDDRLVDVLPASSPTAARRTPGPAGDRPPAAPLDAAAEVGLAAAERAGDERPRTGLGPVLAVLTLAGALPLIALAVRRRRRDR
jgi:hypothetical protein